jgi:hypothetical protein
LRRLYALARRRYAPLRRRFPFHPPLPVFLGIVSLATLAMVWIGMLLLLGGLRWIHAWTHFLHGAWEVYPPPPDGSPFLLYG